MIQLKNPHPAFETEEVNMKQIKQSSYEESSP